MATWVIGDVHGCLTELEGLLGRIGWRPGGDRLWLVGDLVNRGRDSLGVLRWAYRHRDDLVAVLGNHDLHLLARAAGVGRRKRGDTLDEVLEAPDRVDALRWLGGLPLLHREGDWLLVHAGLHPGWSLREAVAEAAAARDVLAGPDRRAVLAAVDSRTRPGWRPGLAGVERAAAAVAVLTRARVVDAEGRPRLGFTGPPEEAPEGCRPWFETSPVVAGGARVVFGHWAQLGCQRGATWGCLDSGCVYGGSLSALRLDDGLLVQQSALAGSTETVNPG
jgi:bis(5'-nucleosyl)-tetraphosphatase (symmetrical)